MLAVASDGLFVAPHALTLDFLVEIELHVFNLVIHLEVFTARVEIQVTFLAVVHKAIDRLCAGVADPSAFVVAGSWWDFKELEGGTWEEFMGNW